MKGRCRRLLALLLTLGMLPFLTGCLNAHSLDRYGYVLAIGFDEGKDQPYEVTLALQNTSASADGNAEGGFQLIKAECANLFDAIEALSGKLPIQLDFARTAFVVVSRKIAESEGGMDKLLTTSFARLRIRFNANLLIALGDANEIISGLSNEIEKNLTRVQSNFSTYSRETGLVPVANLALFYEACWQHGFDAILPVCGTPDTDDAPPLLRADGKSVLLGGQLPAETGMKTGVAGAALFRNGRMVALVDGRDTQLLLMALNEYHRGRVQVESQRGDLVSVFLERDALTRTTLTFEDIPRASVQLSLKATAENIENADEQEIDALERQLEERLTERLTTLFVFCRDAGSDAFALGRAAIKRFQSGEEWLSYDWHAAYANAEATFTVDVTFRNSAGKSTME